MRRLVMVLVIATACAAPGPTITSPPAVCTGTLLDPVAPDRTGWIDALVWLDATTLVAFVGGGSNPRINGVLVFDVAHRTIERAFRGLGPISIAKQRAHSDRELLFFDQVRGDDGWKHRVGRIDLATGCVHTSDRFTAALGAIDPVNDAFVISPNPDNASLGHNTLERWDATTLQRGIVKTVPRFDQVAYDATSNLVVTASYADDVVRVRDPITLDERASVQLGVEARQGFTVRPGHAQIALPYISRCTPTDPRSMMPRSLMRMHCREGDRTQGMILVALDPIAETSTRSELNVTNDCDAQRLTWTFDGSRALLRCGVRNDMVEWIPETGTVRHIPRPPLDYWDRTAWSPDGDTYAGAGSGSTLDVRSLRDALH